MEDILACASWRCTSTPAGAYAGPGELAAADGLHWVPAAVPGTAASALRTAGEWQWGVDDEALFDGRDWWFRCDLHIEDHASDGQRWNLELDGLATIADVWLAGEHVLHSENMFLAHRIPVARPADGAELIVRCSAMSPLLARRHPRPRWKSRLVRHQSMRWYRTTLLGRVPAWSRWAAPVGPWRPIRLVPNEPVTVVTRRLETTCAGEGGVVALRLLLDCGGRTPANVRLLVAGQSASLTVRLAADGGVVGEGAVVLREVERWWPHTHGPQPRYPVSLQVDDQVIELGAVAFRTVQLDREDDAFTLVVNGEPVFLRGACWSGPDVVSLAAPAEDVRRSLRLAAEAGMNLLRVAAYTWYEDDAFWDACDELGMMIWQDCMLAGVDPPQDAAFADNVEQELRQVFVRLQGRPALALICGSSESYQQAAMLGLTAERWANRLLEERIAELVEQLLPGAPYIPSTPLGGDLPFRTNAGVAHYFGVGAYLRPVADVRVAEVRFASECLSFGAPPERETVRASFGAADVAGHDPSWKLAVARDFGAAWDFEDVRDHYVRTMLGVDPLALRYSDPEYALDLGRAVVAELMTTVMSEWRRPGSSCAGALVLTWQDLWPGAGWGVLDSLGYPKSSWFALRRVQAPTAVFVTDEGLAGLDVHIVNDRLEPWTGRLTMTVFSVTGCVSENVEVAMSLGPRSARTMNAELLLGGFRDISRAYRFGPSTQDVVTLRLVDAAGVIVSEATYLPDGPARPRLPHIGLRADAIRERDGRWALRVATTSFAQWVSIDIPGYHAEDSWFHLPPGSSRRLRLSPSGSGSGNHRRPSGTVRAINAVAETRVLIEEPAR